MQSKHPCILSIAGFDPSGGAGILADVKTFEQLQVHGIAACTAITLQTESEFKGVAWIPGHQIEMQIETLLQKYPVQFAKIGLIQNLEVLDDLLLFMKRKFPAVNIIWDPILKSSSGFSFHDHFDEALLFNILSKIFLITPNETEARQLMQAEDGMIAARNLHRFCRVFLKSYTSGNEHADILFEDGKEVILKSTLLHNSEKHGSGCVLSAAIGAMLSKGIDLQGACTIAKQYTHDFMASSEGLLGMHHSLNVMQHA